MKTTSSSKVFFLSFMLVLLAGFGPAKAADDTAVRIYGNDDLVGFSGFLVKDPSKGHVLLVTATHAVSDGKNSSFSVCLQAGNNLPREKFILNIPLVEAIVSLPTSEGDVTIFDLSRFKFSPGTILEANASGETRSSDLVNYGYIGATVFDPSPLFKRNCNYTKPIRDYNNGVQLHEIHCDIPNGFNTGAGTSGSPVLDSQTGKVVGMVSGAFDTDSLYRVGIHSFDLQAILVGAAAKK